MCFNGWSIVHDAANTAGKVMELDYEWAEPVATKINRRRREEANRNRPVVHGAVRYLGHRPDPKHERRRDAQVARQARRRS